MKPDIPLKALACFDAVMRTGSLVAAAESLCVTPGAVGQQIRRLEAWLGVALFTRLVRQLQPRKEAQVLWSKIRPALAQVSDACVELRDGLVHDVHLNLPPALAGKWFARRMPVLVDALPHVRLQVSATPALADFNRAEVNLAIRHCDGQAPGLHATLLLADDLRVYCSPGYRDSLKLEEPRDISRTRLLHTLSHPHWSLWLDSAGVGGIEPNAHLQFDQSLLSIDAARRGQGLVLTSRWLVEDEVETGQLVQLFQHSVSVGRGFYLLRRNDIALGGSIQAVHQWLLAAAREPG